MRHLIRLIVSLVIVVAVGIAAYQVYFKKPAPGSEQKAFELKDGMNADQVAAALKSASIISSQALFSVVSNWSGAAKNFHAGTFMLKPGMSIHDVVQVLTVIGKKEVSVTIPEGWNLRQIADKLASSKVISSADALYAVTGAPAVSDAKVSSSIVKEYPFLADKPSGVSLEGYLFPDTYRFYENSDPEDVVRRILDNFKDKTETALSSANLGGRSVHEVLTVASILEREVTSDADRAKVADLIARRIGQKMPLQMDSTVNYATGRNSPSVSSDELGTDSAWNTYTHKGLPPGPISNPSLGAINAALAPTPNPYWYFLTTKEGKVIYSKTNEEHAAAKAKYID